jgi:large subunit ribosomal protein L13
MGRTQSWDNAWDVKAMSQYNTITSLSESPVKEGVIWAGTDDGFIQVTTDGGDSWKSIPVTKLGIPERSFVNDINVKKDQITSSWYEIDATNAVVGRLATVISKIIRGKNKTTYTPHMDHGDFVVVKNIEQAKFTGKKFQDKVYYKHTGHPGGIKETTPEKLHDKKPGETLKLAVKRMLPGGVLGRKQLTKLKIYAGSEHPHTAQNPQIIELGKLNSKNLVRN